MSEFRPSVSKKPECTLCHGKKVIRPTIAERIVTELEWIQCPHCRGSGVEPLKPEDLVEIGTFKVPPLDAKMQVLYELSKSRALVKRVIEKYRLVYPELHENYGLVYLLVLVEEGAKIPEEVLVWASRNVLPKLTTIDRSLRLVKKLYETPEQKAANEEKEKAFHDAIAQGEWEKESL